MSEHSSPRVNYAQSGNFLRRTVRLIGKVKQVNSNNTLVVECSDGGEIEVTLGVDHTISKVFVEFIGKFEEHGRLKAQAVVNLADEMDMKTLDFVAQMWHDPRYSDIF
ncbi:replication factor A protein 3 [Cristinia sonorae]|uniref:Replication factor A protein 3 n=1 Tax=Cristinia sonorae TaxID=1940300 RepID=A0A8K0XQG3_9AGAR|nr:replication factor A protein 3 [Cristinia sonorae]